MTDLLAHAESVWQSVVADLPTFTVEVKVQGVEPSTAQGRSRQDAEKTAAMAMLKREGVI